MKFFEFPLYYAVHDIYINFEQKKLKPRSADWLIYKNKRNQLTSLIVGKAERRNDFLLPSLFEEEKILKAWDDFGKNKEKYKLIISVANTFGQFCFYCNRNKGVCSDTMCVERLLGHRNDSVKTENCVIVCKRHLTDYR